MLPHVVPRFRTAGCATCLMARFRRGICPAIVEDFATVTWRTSDPTAIALPTVFGSLKSGSPLMSTKQSGEANRRLSAAIRLCPPASIFAFSIFANASRVSSSVSGFMYRKAGAFIAEHSVPYGNLRLHFHRAATHHGCHVGNFFEEGAVLLNDNHGKPGFQDVKRCEDLTEHDRCKSLGWLV